MSRVKSRLFRPACQMQVHISSALTTSFDLLPDSARIWIYQTSRPLTDAELAATNPLLTKFVADWTSHGRALQAGVAFLHRQFLVVGLDESQAGASGCSIDASVHFVQQIERLLTIELLNKSRLAFLTDTGAVQLHDRRELREAAATGALAPESLYFDNTISTKAQLKASWPMPADQTWLRKYFVAALGNAVAA